MNRSLSILAAITFSVAAYACSKSDDGEPSPPAIDLASGDDPSGGGSSGTPAPTAPTAPSTPQKKNPLEGIGAPKVALQADAYTDGPMWHAGLGALFFTTPLGDGALYRLEDATVTTVRNGVAAEGTTPIASTVLASGELVTVDAKRVVRTNVKSGTPPSVVATGFTTEAGVAPFDTLNDVVARKDGTLYVTDPGYFTDPAANRLYRIAPTGAVSVVETFDDVPRPNGLALSPDEKTLYVVLTQPLQGVMPGVRRYPVNANGTLGASATFVTIAPADSTPDGITVDSDGNVYVATKAGIEVFRDDGSKIGTIAIPERPTGVAFGGGDLKTLFVTTQGSRIWMVELAVAGLAQ